MKLNFATPFCKICFKEMYSTSFSSLLGKTIPICNDCLSKMNPIFMRYRIDDIKTTTCYYYNEKIQEMIYRFKGCFDYELGELFLVNQKPFLRMLFHSYYLVPSPSYSARDSERGFNHVQVIFSSIGKGYLTAIKKNDDVKQSDLNAKQRRNIGNHLSWNEDVDVFGKKILFVDDLITTGSTARACCKLIKDHGAKEVQILSLARTISLEDRKKK